MTSDPAHKGAVGSSGETRPGSARRDARRGRHLGEHRARLGASANPAGTLLSTHLPGLGCNALAARRDLFASVRRTDVETITPWRWRE